MQSYLPIGLRLLLIVFLIGLVKPGVAGSGDEKMNEDSLAHSNEASAWFKTMVTPDPSQQSVVLSYVLDKTRDVYFFIVNDSGKAIYERSFPGQTQGSYFIPLETSDLRNNNYFVKLIIDEYIMLKPLVL